MHGISLSLSNDNQYVLSIYDLAIFKYGVLKIFVKGTPHME